MSRISRPILVGALALVILSLACSSLTGAPPTPVGTILPAAQGAPPTSAGLSVTPLIPITGETVASMQCQFCVNGETHAVLIFPDFAYFDVVSSSPVRCLTADVVNGKRILICRGAQETSFNLNICTDSTNCLQFPVVLQACSLLAATPAAPFFLTPVNPSNSSDDESPAQPGDTTLPSPPPDSNPAVPTSPPPAATSVPPTNEPPPPTSEPPEGGGEEGGDVVICHISPGNPDNRKTMTVGQSAWENEHSRHGDSLGPC